MVVVNRDTAPKLYMRFMDAFLYCDGPSSGFHSIAPGNYNWRLMLDAISDELEFILIFDTDQEECAWCLKWL